MSGEHKILSIKETGESINIQLFGKNLENTGFCPSTAYNIVWRLKQPDVICNLPPVDLNTWVHLTYLKKESTLTWF